MSEPLVPYNVNTKSALVTNRINYLSSVHGHPTSILTASYKSTKASITMYNNFDQVAGPIPYRVKSAVNRSNGDHIPARATGRYFNIGISQRLYDEVSNQYFGRELKVFKTYGQRMSTGNRRYGASLNVNPQRNRATRYQGTDAQSILNSVR